MKNPCKKRSAETDIYMRLSSLGHINTLEYELASARKDIETAYNHFQNANDPDMIDCYIYEGNAAWKRYNFLLRQAKILYR